MKKISFEEFREIAIKLNAQPNTLRQWKFRRSIPSEWKIRVFEHTKGAVSLREMAEIFDEEQVREAQ